MVPEARFIDFAQLFHVLEMPIYQSPRMLKRISCTLVQTAIQVTDPQKTHQTKPESHNIDLFNNAEDLCDVASDD